MDENNQINPNPYTEKKYKPKYPRKPGKGFGIASMVLDIFVWGFFVIMSIVKHSIILAFEALAEFDIYILAALVVCGTLAVLAVVFGAIQNMYYKKMKMAIAGIVMGVLFLIFPIIEIILYPILIFIVIVLSGP